MPMHDRSTIVKSARDGELRSGEGEGRTPESAGTGTPEERWRRPLVSPEKAKLVSTFVASTFTPAITPPLVSVARRIWQGQGGKAVASCC